MLFKHHVLEAVAEGAVDLAFRRWDRPRVRAGTRLRTAVGEIAIDAVDRVDPGQITDQEARRAGAVSRAQLLAGLESRGDRPTYRIALRLAGPDRRVALRQRDDLGPGDVEDIERRLERLDRASPRGPWTTRVLQLIAVCPATPAADLAAGLGRDTASFKREVRKLKELGLTESLETGYRLSPRGDAFLSRTHPDASMDPPG